MPRPVISVENLSKAYRIGLKEEVPDTLTSALIGFAKAPLRKFQELRRLDTFRHTGEADDIVWALKDVSFEVQEGEVLGVIGRNGAGKSTLLKILSRITEPTSGRAVIRGRVSSLLEVGTGFHPELSGRENVYLNGTILGMTKAEIDAKFDEIVDFSGVEKFLDTPIKRYSSGMKVRLAFAVAAHLEPEILIIDEVLAVGDAEFQKKCLGKMQDVARGGRTVLFVSHNMEAVTALCSRALLVVGGRGVVDGNVTTAVQRYYDAMAHPASSWHRPTLPGNDAPVFINELSALPCSLSGSARYNDSQDIPIRIVLTARRSVDRLQIAVRLTNQASIAVLTTAHTDASPQPIPLSPGIHTFTIVVPGNLLCPGQYTLTAAAHVPSVELFDIVENAVSFSVHATDVSALQLKDGRLGVVAPRLRWAHEGVQECCGA
jgi:lipopolysaccharide transport system ATP-binding protein